MDETIQVSGGYTLTGPKLKWGAFSGLGVQVGSTDVEAELRLYEENTAVVPGGFVILHFDPVELNVDPPVPPITFLKFGSDQYDPDPDDPEKFRIPVSDALYAAMLGASSTSAPAIEIFFDLSEYCTLPSTVHRSYDALVGWSRDGTVDELCDQAKKPLTLAIEPAHRNVQMTLGTLDINGECEEWTLENALDPCYADGDEAHQYFQVPYRITNQGGEPIKIRRLDINRHTTGSIQQLGLAISSAMGGCVIATDAGHPVWISAPFDGNPCSAPEVPAPVEPHINDRCVTGDIVDDSVSGRKHSAGDTSRVFRGDPRMDGGGLRGSGSSSATELGCASA
ncbi:MAG: hypothetical protein IPK99_12515 [Flavobacteriales bacterium]|nr:hypothetical protein [Flavobacteriales bacterium]